jgi:phosphohistidine phosphatase SixA
MRHAQSNVGQDANLLQTPVWWENCAIQRNISDPGREQARKVGAAIRDLAIPVNHVIAAQFCRTRDTAHLMGLGPIEITEDLNHQIGQRPGFDVNAARFKRLATGPASGMNNLLVSHTHGSPRTEERIMGGLLEAEIVVYRPDGNGGSEPIARIPPAEWDNLSRLQASGKL